MFGQIAACSEGPVGYFLETSTCLETTQQERTNFTVLLLMDDTDYSNSVNTFTVTDQ